MLHAPPFWGGRETGGLTLRAAEAAHLWLRRGFDLIIPLPYSAPHQSSGSCPSRKELELGTALLNQNIKAIDFYPSSIGDLPYLL